MIRPATKNDAADLARIYSPYVTGTSISFEEEPPSSNEIVKRVEDAVLWLVCEVDGIVVGYAYAGTFNSRPAYRWSVEVSTYVESANHRTGVGSLLLDELLRQLRDAGFVNAFSGIALPNPASIGLFESRGFVQKALYESVGFKNGQWHDVGWWQLELRSPRVPPPVFSTQTMTE